MSKWYCELSESYHNTPDDAMDTCREFIEPSDYHERVYEIETGRLFEALTNPQLAQEVWEEILDTTETYFFMTYITEVEEKEDEEE